MLNTIKNRTYTEKETLRTAIFFTKKNSDIENKKEFEKIHE